MPLFDKVIQESGEQSGDLQSILSRKIRDKKLQEMDDITIERQVQAEQTKTAEMAARQTEAEVRKTNAEISIADKFMPQGMWTLMAELLKDRNPNQPMTVQDMMAILDYAKSQQGDPGAPPQTPPDGMWGFLTAIMQNNISSNQSTSPVELVQLIQTISSMGRQQAAPESAGSELANMVNIFSTMKSLFAPAQSQVPSGTQISMPGGGTLSLDELLKFQDHSFNLEMKKVDHDEKVKNFQTAREVAPQLIPAITEVAQALRQSGKPEAKRERVQKKVEELPARQNNGGFQLVICPDCNFQFGVPAGLDLDKVDITCPVCAVTALNLRKGEVNDQKSLQNSSQEQVSGEEGANPAEHSDNSQS